MDSIIRTEAALQDSVGKLNGPRDIKVIDFIDAGARRWLARSTLMSAALDRIEGIDVVLAGGAPGFVDGSADASLRLRRADLDDPDRVSRGAGFGGLFLVPGLRETLRINGRVEQVDDWVTVQVEECYLHCAKALIRSQFWAAADGDDRGDGDSGGSGDSGDSGGPAAHDGDDLARLLGQARLLALASADAGHHADLSPKGDPAGLLVRLEGERVLFADRPGNRRTDSFLNLLQNPRAALLALTPGQTRVARIHGTASLTRDDALRASFAVDGKVPTLVVQLSDLRTEIFDSPAMKRAALWPAAAAPADLDPAQLFAAHVRANRSRGPAALMVKAMVSIPGAMRKGLEQDYRNNLY